MESEDDDLEALSAEQQIAKGIEAGNINIDSNDVDIDGNDFNLQIMSREAEAAQEEHEKLLQSIEAKRLKQNLRIPTDDDEVKQRLRTLKQPICFFGEDASDRRDRLRDIIAQMISSNEVIPEFRKNRNQLEIDLATIAEKINTSRPYWSKGNPLIKIARIKILNYSMKRAAKRIKVQLKLRENPLPPKQMKQEKNKIISNLSQFKCQSSYYYNNRPIVCCDMIECNKNDNDDEYTLLFGTQNGDISIWNQFGKMKNEINAHDERITSIAIMPNSQNDIKFISCSADGLAKLWNVKGEELNIYNNSNRENEKYRLGKCKFHPMNNYFVTTSFDRSWSFWDINKSKVPLLRQTGHSTSVYCCDFHPDGSLIGTGDLGGIVRLWDLRSGRAIFGGDSHASSILDINFNVNGYIFASSSSDNTIKIWDLRKHTEYTIPAHFNLISSICFEPNNGQYLVSSSFDKSVKIWSMKKSHSYNFKLIHKMNGHHSRISDLSISKHKQINKQFIITCSHDKTWKLWANNDALNNDDTNQDEDDDIKIKKEPNNDKMELD